MSALADVLCVWAHPDDEALCAAGTLALCAARGLRVSLICATRGEYGPIADPALAERESLGQVRERELRESCAALGVTQVELLGLPDAGVAWAAPQSGTLHELVLRIRRLRPRVLIGFGPDGLYGHPDHVAMGQLAVDARRMAADARYDAAGLAAHWVPRHFFAVWTRQQVQKWLSSLVDAGTPGELWGLQPEHFPLVECDVTARVDVLRVLERKLRALRSHRTQLARDHALSLLADRAPQQAFGVECFRCADGLAGGPPD